MSMNSVKRNQRIFSDPAVWADSNNGEDWSKAWGSSEAQWYGSLYPRIHRYLPTGRVLEIGSGCGRWSHYLAGLCDELVGTEIVPICVEKCNERFRDVAHLSFVQTDGRTLEGVGDGLFNFVFSFESLVHANRDALSNYINSILAHLELDGVAFIHHSNLEAVLKSIKGEKINLAWRAPDVSAEWVMAEIQAAGGHVISQELHSRDLGHRHLTDTMTIFSHKTPSDLPTRRLENPSFIEECALWKSLNSIYFPDI